MPLREGMLELVARAQADIVDLAAALDDAAEHGAFDGDIVVALYRLQAQVGAATAKAVAGFDRSGSWRSDGARSAVGWLAVTTRLPKAQLRRDLRLGRAVRDRLPVCGTAWAAGDVAEAHVAVIASLGGGRADEQLATDEAVLVAQAQEVSFGELRRSAAYWEQAADPDGCDEADEQRRSRRDVSLVESFDGVWLGHMTLDPTSGAVVAGELKRLERDLFETDWAEAKARFGREPGIAELGRSPAQRRADALVAMATRSRSTPPGTRRPRPLFTVVVDYPTFGRICELASGQVVAPGGLVRWIGEADIERVVFGPGSRVDVGARARLFSGALRRAVEIRDRVCAHPFCDEPVDACQVDHIEPYVLGGLTTLDNGRLLCGHHNRARHAADRTRTRGDRAPRSDPLGWDTHRIQGPESDPGGEGGHGTEALDSRSREPRHGAGTVGQYQHEGVGDDGQGSDDRALPGRGASRSHSPEPSASPSSGSGSSGSGSSGSPSSGSRSSGSRSGDGPGQGDG